MSLSRKSKLEQQTKFIISRMLTFSEQMNALRQNYVHFQSNFDFQKNVLRKRLSH